MTALPARLVRPTAPRSPTGWLAATTMGTYLLIVVGAVTALTPAASACGDWPTCDGYWIVPFTDLTRMIAWSHRFVTVLVGLALCWTAVRIVRTGSRRVRATTLVALALFPLQVVIGGVTAVSQAGVALAASHLVFAMLIFTALLLALTWHLEETTPNAHFYNQALAYEEDYAAGDFPMLPVVRGEATTRKHVLRYLGATLFGAAALGSITSFGWFYAGTAFALGGVFLWAVIRLHRERTDRAAFRAFHASNASLGSLLLAIVIDTAVL